MKIRFAPIETPHPQLVLDKWSQSYWHCIFHRVMYCDTDQAKVVYHGNYAKYFELGRDSLMKSIGESYRAIEESGIHHPIVKMEIQYLQPLRYDDEISIYIRPSRLEVVRFSFEYRIMKDHGQVLTSWGSTQHCCINRNFVPIPVDPVVLRLFSTMPDFGKAKQ